MNSEMPSTPTVYRMPHAAIHGTSTTNCMPAAGWNTHHSGIERANSARLAASATCLAQRSGASSTAAAASAGQAMSAVSTACAYMRYRTTANTTARTPTTNSPTYTPTSPVCSRLPTHPTARDAAAVPFTSSPSTTRTSTTFHSTSRDNHITGRTTMASYSSSTYHLFQSSRPSPRSGGARRAGTSVSGLSRRRAATNPSTATSTADTTSAHSVAGEASAAGATPTSATRASQCSSRAPPPNSKGMLSPPPSNVSTPSRTSGP